MVVKRRNRGHDDRTRLLGTDHILQMNAIERRVSHAENELAILFEHHVGGARNQVVADPIGDCAERTHRAGDHQHRIHAVTPGRDGSAHIFVGQNFDFCRRAVQNACRELS